MFYSISILSKKGPLGKIWLAAHQDGKLTKISIYMTNIPKAIGKLVDGARARRKKKEGGPAFLGNFFSFSCEHRRRRRPGKGTRLSIHSR